MPDYDWTCHACGKTVAANLETCDACGCPAVASAVEMERWKRGDRTRGVTTRLPVVKIIIGAFAILWQRRSRMTVALLPAAAGLITIGILFSHLMEAKRWGYFLIIALGYSLFLTVFAVTCHRLVLLGDQAVSHFGLFSWSSRETRFFGWMVGVWCVFLSVSFLLLMLVGALGLLVITFIPFWLLTALVWIPGIYLLSRFSLVLPATAIDERPSLAWAWQRSQGNSWRLVIVVGLLPWVFSFAQAALVREGATIVEEVVIGILGLLLLAVEIVALSLSYRALSVDAKGAAIRVR